MDKNDNSTGNRARDRNNLLTIAHTADLNPVEGQKSILPFFLVVIE